MYLYRLGKDSVQIDTNDSYLNRLDNIIICISDQSLEFGREIADKWACSLVFYAHSSLSSYSVRRSIRSIGYHSSRA